ncbi:MAG: nucleotide sugar dehydrogenase [Sandaracinus sp.]
MSGLAALRARIERREAVVGFVGLGYVGLPAACSFAEAGLRVIGIDRKAERVRAIAAGTSPIEGDEPELAELLARVVGSGALRVSTDTAALAEADVVIVCVDTPVEADHRPRYEALESAIRGIGAVLREGALVVIESTVSPGTCRGRVAPWLAEATGGALGVRFHLGHCPERVMPGRLLKNMREMPRVAGGSSPEVAEILRALYAHVVRADVDAADLTTAEIVKTGENAFRDVQIAFANQLARVCEDAGADFLEVRRLVNRSPGRNVLFAGAGVGGHCIPKDPWLLAAGARAELPLIAAARAVNEAMPARVGSLVEEMLGALTGATIAILGQAYLEGSDDDRHSPTDTLVAWLRARGATVRVHDPFVLGFERDLDRVVIGADALVVMVAHPTYASLPLGAIGARMRRRVAVDGRRVLDLEAARLAGFATRSIGLPGPAAPPR